MKRLLTPVLALLLAFAVPLSFSLTSFTSTTEAAGKTAKKKAGYKAKGTKKGAKKAKAKKAKAKKGKAKKGKEKARYCGGTYKYFDKKAGKCADARDKKTKS